MKRFLLISLFTASVLYTFGQQDKLVSHFIYNKMAINPGKTGVGLGHEVCGTLIYRDQWDKFVGAPNSTIVNVESNLSEYFPSALGVSYYYDEIGFTKQNNFTINYAYHLPLANGVLGLGAALGIVNYGIEPHWITPDQNSNDASLPTGTAQTNFDANLGAYYMSLDGWYAGLSVTHLPAMELAKLNFNTARHYYIMGGYRLNDAFAPLPLDLEANVLVRTDMKLLSADINVRAIWNNMFTLGLTYRTFDAVAILAGVKWHSFTLGYSYDISVNRISDISQGSHELLLRYCMPLPAIPVTKARNPRFL